MFCLVEVEPLSATKGGKRGAAPSLSAWNRRLAWLGARSRQLRSERTGEEFSASAVLFSESKDFFVHVERIEPGRRSSSRHYHRVTDEILFVLKGEMTISEGAYSIKALVGDGVRFAANSGLGHTVQNNGADVAEFLVFSRQLPGRDVVMVEE